MNWIKNASRVLCLIENKKSFSVYGKKTKRNYLFSCTERKTGTEDIWTIHERDEISRNIEHYYSGSKDFIFIYAVKIISKEDGYIHKEDKPSVVNIVCLIRMIKICKLIQLIRKNNYKEMIQEINTYLNTHE